MSSPPNQHEDGITVEIRWSSSRSLLRLSALHGKRTGGLFLLAVKNRFKIK